MLMRIWLWVIRPFATRSIQHARVQKLGGVYVVWRHGFPVRPTATQAECEAVDFGGCSDEKQILERWVTEVCGPGAWKDIEARRLHCNDCYCLGVRSLAKLDLRAHYELVCEH